MQKRFAQVKRYSLEGSESMMVAMSALFDALPQKNIEDCVIGMPHRGRLNLMTGLLNYPPEALFSKLKGNPEMPPAEGFTGDVLSHLCNFSFNLEVCKNNVGSFTATLLPNPSHLEAVNPVALGWSRSQMKKKKVLSVQLHGDAAFSGQGIVYESLALSNLPGYSVNGTIHIVVNNQLGFTTSKVNGRY